jgi:hypothetical protein
MTDATTWYAGNFKNWSIKALGAKPTADQLEAIHLLGLRPGKQALANAMALRPEGVTNAQIIQACGNPQLNRMRGLIADKLVKREPVPMTGAGHTVYKLTLTPKGEQRISKARERLAAAAVEANATDGASKPAGKPKVKKARVAKAKAEKPASDAPKPADTASKLPVVLPVNEGQAAMNETPQL